MELLKKILLFLGSLIIARWFYKSRSENIINLNEEKIFKSSPIGAVSEYKGILHTFYNIVMCYDMRLRLGYQIVRSERKNMCVLELKCRVYIVTRGWRKVLRNV